MACCVLNTLRARTAMMVHLWRTCSVCLALHCCMDSLPCGPNLGALTARLNLEAWGRLLEFECTCQLHQNALWAWLVAQACLRMCLHICGPACVCLAGYVCFPLVGASLVAFEPLASLVALLGSTALCMVHRFCVKVAA
jgi:hypothetical protein